MNTLSTPTIQPQTLTKIGVIGGGQLAWMMGMEAASLGVSLFVQTPHTTDPAVAFASETILAAIDDATATAKLATRCDVITFENEFVDLNALSKLAEQGACFRPRLQALSLLLDKYDQLSYLEKIGLPVPAFQLLTAENNQTIDHNLGYPVVLKACRYGYDGQGTFIIKNPEELSQTWAKFNYPPMLLQKFVPFERELAVIAARSVTGEVVVYPIVETVQKNQVCHRVIVPANINKTLSEQIEAIAKTLLNSLQVIGVFGIELFLTSEGELLVNEIAPRTHNSGHFSLDACETSQFKQHLRAVSGLPLGNTALNCSGAVMVNLLGFETANSDYSQKRQKIAEIPNTFIRWYGKTASRPGRKLGHVTVLIHTENDQNIEQEAKTIADKIESFWYS
ncbi:N5-carboxyaminoimidazole ribonucleotide synthase [Planktothrix serta PCC 8927]|uniref:N5-carboxyaminoimidazole ribonucleotide synthase n=1 Tax=Planktothrix serta PCC 8927 TaxID=671068 RepID=A0A7Z9BNA9_9CYAN|nr:5-(carboxyamino)imidazole ribonucleotide synthase [Planktothrix serta]VXD16584.1 N5-carboxyaminoimidazole ribonucleotide synthase [Planktothrix serta PCC 8927]